MKLLATAIFTGMMAFGTAACAKEEPKAPVAVAAPAEAPKTKKVCIKTTDPKTQKEVEKCRTVKLHEKHEGTKMSDAQKDSKKEAPKK